MRPYVNLQFISLKKVYEHLLHMLTFQLNAFLYDLLRLLFVRKSFSIGHFKRVSQLYVNLCVIVRLFSPRKTLNKNCKKKFFWSVLFLCERMSTLHAMERFFSSMCFHMCTQSWAFCDKFCIYICKVSLQYVSSYV